MESAKSRHSALFEAYFGVSAKEAESWSTHEFEDIEVSQLLQKHSLLITNGVAQEFLEPFKAFKHAMRELVRLAGKKVDQGSQQAKTRQAQARLSQARY